MNTSPHYFLDSRSSPNLARLRQNRDADNIRYGNNSQSNTMPGSHGSQRLLRSVHIVSDYDTQSAIDINSQHGNDKHANDGTTNPSKLSRSERKRLWRKNLSAEKLAKLRERDALRKRVERMNMSAEKRRDLRTKDTARKAALRKERRLTDSFSPGPSQSMDAVSTDTENVGSSSRHYASHGQQEVSTHGSYRRSSHHLQSNRRNSGDDEFTKIPVHSLLNWVKRAWMNFFLEKKNEKKMWR